MRDVNNRDASLESLATQGAASGFLKRSGEKIMLIGELSKRSGFPRDTIRYYEKLGLFTVGRDRRAGNGYKNYSPEVLERLHQVHRLKDCGFTLLEIKSLLANGNNGPICDDLPAQLVGKIARIDAKMAMLSEYKQSLLEIQKSCNGACSTTQGLPDCIPRATNR